MRTPEQGHTVKCLSSAMICAIENARDAGMSEYDFRLWAQDNATLHEADGYLADGTATCTCPPIDIYEDYRDEMDYEERWDSQPVE